MSPTDFGYSSVPRQLTVLPASLSSDRAALVWTRPPATKEGLFEVVVDGVPAGRTSWTDFTLKDLQPSRDYRIGVRTVLAGGTVSRLSNIVTIRTCDPPPVVDVAVVEARGDGETLNTQALQRAIDQCPAGGVVRVPPGRFLTGALFLKGDMTLELTEGATLLGSDQTKDYPLMRYRWEGREHLCYASLLNTRDTDGRLSQIAITGPGTIDANGSRLRKRELEEAAGKPGRAICLRNVDGVYLGSVVVRQSPAWCVHLVYCRGVTVNGVEIATRVDEHGRRYEGIANGDGLNPDSCSQVYIVDTTIASQDDCIAIKSGRDDEGREVGIPSEHIRISHCRFQSGFGIALGSEMSGGIRDVVVNDCEYSDAYSIASLKAPRGRGGVIEEVLFERIKFRNLSTEHSDCKWFRGGLLIDQFYSHDEFDASRAEPIGPGTAKIRNIEFRDIDLETLAGNAIYLVGLPESPLEDIRLGNVSARGKRGMKAANIRGLTLQNVFVTSAEDDQMVLNRVELG